MVINMNMSDQELRYTKFEQIMGKVAPAEFCEWLIKNGFFTAVASKNHHGNYEGGLFDHSMKVTEILVNLTKANRLKWQHPRSPVVVGMFHDLCKIDQYKSVVDDPGREMFGGGIQGRTYKIEYNDNFLIPGHGDKSVMYLASHMKLTEEEVLCIRWHMGAFDNKDNWKYYSAAVRKFPNVLWTHQADMIASQVEGV
jgi:hypothetical protein